MTGGRPADTFLITAVSESRPGQTDLITDFEAVRDIIGPFDIDANVIGDQSFAFLGTLAFTGTGPQARFQQDAGNNQTLIEVRLAVALSSSMEIVLTGLIDLQVTNFDL